MMTESVRPAVDEGWKCAEYRHYHHDATVSYWFMGCMSIFLALMSTRSFVLLPVGFLVLGFLSIGRALQHFYVVRRVDALEGQTEIPAKLAMITTRAPVIPAFLKVRSAATLEEKKRVYMDAISV